MNPMKWYWHQAGGHTHVRVFMNGGKCGDLCFRNEEFEYIRETGLSYGGLRKGVEFIQEGERETAKW